MKQRGGFKTHTLVLTINIITLIAIILFVAINNLETSMLPILIGFSPSFIAILINSFLDKKKITDGYYYLFVPFLTTAMFITYGILFLNPITKQMDLEIVSSINFMYTLFFAFMYYFSTKILPEKKSKINHKPQEKIVEKLTPKIEEKQTKEKEHKTHIVEHHHNHTHVQPKLESIREENSPKTDVIEEKNSHGEKLSSAQNLKTSDASKTDIIPGTTAADLPYIEELKKEFNIININQESIIQSLRELRHEQHNRKDIELYQILNKFEKDRIYFASNTGQKYHKPLCIVINHINHDKIIAFKGEKEAQNKGYKPCSVCMPDN